MSRHLPGGQERVEHVRPRPHVDLGGRRDHPVEVEQHGVVVLPRHGPGHGHGKRLSHRTGAGQVAALGWRDDPHRALVSLRFDRDRPSRPALAVRRRAPTAPGGRAGSGDAHRAGAHRVTQQPGDRGVVALDPASAAAIVLRTAVRGALGGRARAAVAPRQAGGPAQLASSAALERGAPERPASDQASASLISASSLTSRSR